jgi:NAD(P)-dependent dehydrogenase (short-subunit alcohol dehydrogenase family)
VPAFSNEAESRQPPVGIGLVVQTAQGTTSKDGTLTLTIPTGTTRQIVDDHKLTSNDLLSDVFGNLCLCEIGVSASAVNIKLIETPDSVRDIAGQIRSTTDDLAVLIHSAAALVHQRRINSAGHEAMFATNVLSRSLLTQELQPLLAFRGRRTGDQRHRARPSG